MRRGRATGTPKRCRTLPSGMGQAGPCFSSPRPRGGGAAARGSPLQHSLTGGPGHNQEPRGPSRSGCVSTRCDGPREFPALGRGTRLKTSLRGLTGCRPPAGRRAGRSTDSTNQFPGLAEAGLREGGPAWRSAAEAMLPIRPSQHEPDPQGVESGGPPVDVARLGSDGSLPLGGKKAASGQLACKKLTGLKICPTQMWQNQVIHCMISKNGDIL